MTSTRDQALAALTQAVESGAAVAEIVHLASRMADAQVAEAMAGRGTIEQAKGIVIRDRCCTPDEAFKALALLSQKQNRKLHDVAQALVDSARR